jgi:hypothetical protein
VSGLLGLFTTAIETSVALAWFGTVVFWTFGLVIAGGVKGSTAGRVGVIVLGTPLSSLSITASFGKVVLILRPRPFVGATLFLVEGAVTADGDALSVLEPEATWIGAVSAVFGKLEVVFAEVAGAEEVLASVADGIASPGETL